MKEISYRLEILFEQYHYLENLLFEFVDEKTIDKALKKVRKEIFEYLKDTPSPTNKNKGGDING